MGEDTPEPNVRKESVKDNLKAVLWVLEPDPSRSLGPIDHDHRPRAWGYLTSKEESRHDWSRILLLIHDSICDTDTWHGYETQTR